LTFDWSIIDFLSCLENSVALSHISKLHTLLRKSSHMHALHELSNLFKKFICREICANWTINSQLCLWNAIWLFDQLIIHAYSEAIFREIYFFCKFFSSFKFSVWSVQAVFSCVQTGAVQMAKRSSDTYKHVRFCRRVAWLPVSGRVLYRF